jgi:hypothetical protein
MSENEYETCTTDGKGTDACAAYEGLPTVEQAQREHDRNVRSINAGETFPARKAVDWHRRG